MLDRCLCAGPCSYAIPEAHTVIRGTLRYKGNPAFVKSFADAGFLNDDPQDYLQVRQ